MSVSHREIREVFYSYFQKNGHHKVLSAPLVPARDPTLLFTNAGMNQFKDTFLQLEKRDYTKAVSIQKCMRVSGKHNDFDEVGRTDFHHTFFEMLGNFSFGDYFKEEAIEHAWRLLSDRFALSPERLWITVYEDDEEARRIWEQKIGVPPAKIQARGEKDNFWQMGETGPCGPCSEIHYDRGDAFGPPDFRDDNRRFVEIWNLVFMQFQRDESGRLQPLPKPSIDTGMGMERLCTVLQGVKGNYQTDLFTPIIQGVADLAGLAPHGENVVNFNVIADHSRALAFLIADGVMPANDGRGYVLRRILRRAVKHGTGLGFKGPFLHRVCGTVIEVMKASYPELEHNQKLITEIILAEEEKFHRTLEKGLNFFLEILTATKEKGAGQIPGNELFRLSDTYGFPVDFARDLASEQNLAIDYDGFQRELDGQKERSRVSLAEKTRGAAKIAGLDGVINEFVGYDRRECEAEILAIYKENRPVAQLQEGEQGILVVNRTPFYPEGGGQTGDRGTAKSENAFLIVCDTKRATGDARGAILHHVTVEKGSAQTGENLRLEVDSRRRQAIATHHSATHLLHAALREVLGLHVKQAGSYVGPDKLRFDFTHFKALHPGEIAKVEEIVNRKIRENIPISQRQMKYDEALKAGAMAIFEEKYGDTVRVIGVENFSRELCGGTHLEATGEIGVFSISGESSSASGVRRIEALAGEAAYHHLRHGQQLFQRILGHFGQKPDTLFDHLVALESKTKEKRTESAPAAADSLVSSLLERATPVNGTPSVVAFVTIADAQALAALADELKNRIQGIAILLSDIHGKATIVVSIAKTLTGKFKANIMIKELATMVNGKGGGRSDFAQAGGGTIPEAAAFEKKACEVIASQS